MSLRTMGDRPIIFSAPMVRALLDGRKTQTRRILKPQPFASGYHEGEVGVHLCGGSPETAMRFNAQAVGSDILEDERPLLYRVGTRLWVRESWTNIAAPGYEPVVFYKADPDDREGHATPPGTRWRPSIHMPRWASRLTLIVTDVRVERLQDISEEDAKAEGAGISMVYERETPNHRAGFYDIWRSINGLGSWEANPWVSVISFTVHHCNIDAMTRAVSMPEPSHA